MILIFAGKEVGFFLTRYLVLQKEAIGMVVVSSSKDEDIIDLCVEHSVKYEVYSKQLIADIIHNGQKMSWILNLWSPHILPNELLKLSERRANLHPSLVPYARGADSTAWIIREQLPAGVSIIDITPDLDGGDVYAQKIVKCPFPIKGKDFHAVLKNEIIELFINNWALMKNQIILPLKQRGLGNTHTRRETNADRIRNSSDVMSLYEMVTWILAHDFLPGTSSEMRHEGKSYELEIILKEKV